jgi:hypothetical protein
MIYHIIPKGEIMLHADSEECSCDPFIDHFDGNVFIRHWSILDPEEESDELKGVICIDLTHSEN